MPYITYVILWQPFYLDKSSFSRLLISSSSSTKSCKDILSTTLLMASSTFLKRFCVTQKSECTQFPLPSRQSTGESEPSVSLNISPTVYSLTGFISKYPPWAPRILFTSFAFESMETIRMILKLDLSLWVFQRLWQTPPSFSVHIYL